MKYIILKRTYANNAYAWGHLVDTRGEFVVYDSSDQALEALDEIDPKHHEDAYMVAGVRKIRTFKSKQVMTFTDSKDFT